MIWLRFSYANADALNLYNFALAYFIVFLIKFNFSSIRFVTLICYSS